MDDDSLPLDGPMAPPLSGGAPRSLVVFLHGLGADGHDLIGIAKLWQAALPDTVFVSPHAPQPCDMAPPGVPMGRQWFSLLDRSPAAIVAGVLAARPVLDAYLDALLAAHGLNDGAMALVGFSQGGMMALYCGLRRATACAGIVGYSTALVGADRLAAELTARPPVMLVHGDADPVVDPAAMPHAERALTEHGVAVETHLRPGLAHGIDEHGIAAGGTFLARVLGR